MLLKFERKSCYFFFILKSKSFQFFCKATADFHYEAGDFSDKRVLLIEWTHAGNPNLKGVDISVFLYSTPEETLERRKKRARNANTDTPLIALVLELEQIMLNENAKNADIIQMMNGQILNAAEYKEMIGDR